MAVPEIQRVEAIGGEEVEVLGPETLVVEEGEQLRRVRVLVHLSAREDVGLLHPDARAAEEHDRGVGDFDLPRKLAALAHAARELQTPV
jgi:hypothetical protein